MPALRPEMRHHIYGAKPEYSYCYVKSLSVTLKRQQTKHETNRRSNDHITTQIRPKQSLATTKKSKRMR